MLRTGAFLAAGLAVIFGLPGQSSAQDLRGEWRFLRQGHNGDYMGTLIIDRGGQARLKGRSPTQDYSECGYVQFDGDRVEVVFTSARGSYGYSPDHFYCSTPDGHTLSCRNIDAAGNGGEAAFTVMRIGRLPGSVAGRLEDICPPREEPDA